MKSSYETVRRVALWLLLPVSTAVLGACDSVVNLDESAQTFIDPSQFYKTDAQAQQAVNGVYAPLMGWNGWKQPAQHSMMCDDNEMFCWNWMGGGASGQFSSQWYIQDNSVWFGNYQIIERANEVIENVNASSGISPAMKDVATGQALFARAYAYFDLARRYGAVPLRLKAYKPDAQLGALPRSPVDSVYMQITKDLGEAATKLPASYSLNNGQGLPRAASAWGLLAKVYLHMAGEVPGDVGQVLAGNKNTWLDSARVIAQRVMSDPTVALEQNYVDLFNPQKQNTSQEILWAIQGAGGGGASGPGSNIPAFFTPRGDCTLIGGCGQGFINMRIDFYRTFDTLTDKRVEPYKLIARKWEATQSSLGKIPVIHMDSVNILNDKGLLVSDVQFRWESWSGECGWYGHRYDSLTVRTAVGSPTTTTFVVGVALPVYSLKYIDPTSAGGGEYAGANNFIVLRLADVMLVYAEAENERNGGSTLALNAVNAVRARANLGPLSGLSQAQLRQAIWTERAHELYGEFQARFDLIREGRWLQVMNTTSSVPEFAGHGQCRSRQAYQKLYPIPNREMAANPQLTQNPGW